MGAFHLAPKAQARLAHFDSARTALRSSLRERDFKSFQSDVSNRKGDAIIIIPEVQTGVSRSNRSSHILKLANCSSLVFEPQPELLSTATMHGADVVTVSAIALGGSTGFGKARLCETCQGSAVLEFRGHINDACVASSPNVRTRSKHLLAHLLDRGEVPLLPSH